MGAFDDLDAGGYGDDNGGLGPWDDELAGLAEVDALLGRREALSGQQMAEDIAAGIERRPSIEHRLANAMDRIERGTYVPPGQASFDQTPGICGPMDVVGQCSSRYHQADCMANDLSTGTLNTPEAVRAWNHQLGRIAESTRTAMLANPAGPGWDELLDPRESMPPASGLAYLRHTMGLDDAPAPVRLQALPAVGSLAAELGLK
jgi:hypothetical protein